MQAPKKHARGSARKGSAVSFRRAAWSSAILVWFFAACSERPDPLRDLPELPPELAQNLAVARTAPVLMTKPPAAADSGAPASASPPVPLAPAKACTIVHEGYVTFPITVCQPPNELSQALDLGTAQTADTRKTTVPATRYFRLTSHPLVRSNLPWFCATRGGPWYGQVESRQICNANPNIHSVTAVILGAPEAVAVHWTEDWSKEPPLSKAPEPLKLVAVSQTGEFCSCCSGNMCPDGSCVPEPQQCNVMPPALK